MNDQWEAPEWTVAEVDELPEWGDAPEAPEELVPGLQDWSETKSWPRQLVQVAEHLPAPLRRKGWMRTARETSFSSRKRRSLPGFFMFFTGRRAFEGVESHVRWRTGVPRWAQCPWRRSESAGWSLQRRCHENISKSALGPPEIHRN